MGKKQQCLFKEQGAQLQLSFMEQRWIEWDQMH